MSLNKGFSCFVNGFSAPFIGMIVYWLLYSLTLLEQVLREAGYDPWLLTAVVVAILTILTVVVDLGSALRDPLCALISVVGMWVTIAILWTGGLYDLISITLQDVLMSTTASTLAIMLISYTKHGSERH